MPLLALPDLPPTLPRLLDADYERLREADPSFSNVCPTCSDKKQFTWLDAADEPAVYECNCSAQRKLRNAFLHAGIGMGYQRLSWHDVRHADEAAQMFVLEYAANIEANVQAGQGLVLWGEGVGTGKTTMAILLLKRLVSSGYDGYFTTFDRMIDSYASGWRDRDDQKWFLRRVTNAGLLVVDDVGRERKVLRTGTDDDGKEALQEYGTALAESLFDSVVRARLAAARPTIITSNKSTTEMNRLYSANVMSLLSEAVWEQEVKGADFRPRQAERRREELLAGLRRPIVVG